MAGLTNGGGGGGATAIRAGLAYVELFLKDNAVWRALDRVQDRFRQTALTFGKAGVAVGGLGASITAGFKPALDALGDHAQIADLGDLFGLTGEKASRLFGIMAAGGSDLRDAQEGLVTLNQRINDAVSGKGEEAKDFFKELGVSAQDFLDLDVSDRFFKLIDAIQKSNSPLGKLGLLMKAVGEDTGKSLGGALQLTSAQVRELGDAFETSSEDLNAARDAVRAQKLATAQLGAVWGQVASAIAPVVKELAGAFGQWVKPVAEFVKNNRELVATVFKVGGALAAAGVGFVALGGVAAAVSVAIGGFGAIASTVFGLVAGAVGLVADGLGLVLAPIGLVAAAVAGLGYLWVTQTESGAKAWESLTDLAGEFAQAVTRAWQYVAGVATEAWGGIVAAVKKGDLALAGEIAVTALELLWQKALDEMSRVWTDFTTPIVETWHEVTDGLGELFTEFYGVVKDVLTGIWEYVSEVFNGVWDTVKGVVGQIKDAWNSLSDSARAVVAFLGGVLAPIAGPFLALASLVEDAWGGMSTNLMETLNNFASFVEKTFYRIEAMVVNSLHFIIRKALEAAAESAEALDRVTPGGRFKRIAGELRDKAGEFGGVSADEKVDEVEKKRKALEDDLRAKREEARKAREAGRAEEAAKAGAKAKELEDRLAELVGRAKEPGFAPEKGDRGGGDFGPAAQRAAESVGSRGSFSAAMAGQRFGAETVQKQQLNKLKDIEAAAQDIVRGVEDVARRLVLQ